MRDYHRHLFYVKLAVSVNHTDRQIEFFDLQNRLETYLDVWRNEYFDHSCEYMAETLLHEFDADWAEVSEDNENGAIVSREK